MNKYEIRDKAKLYTKYVMRIILKFFWFFPIKQRTIFFMANMGKGYLCNPKYIFKSMINSPEFNEYKFVWCFQDPSLVDHTDFDKRTTIIKKKNYLAYFYYLLSSGIVIYNCGGFSYAPIRKKQLLIETWHGGGAFKKVGLVVDNKSISSKRGIQLAMKDVKIFLSSCELATNALIREAMGYEGCVLNSGFPRNDILFHDNTTLKQSIRKRLHVDNDNNIILYAPTFRGDEKHAVEFNTKAETINPVMIKDAFTKKYGGKWTFYTRGHLYSNDIVLSGADGDWSKYPDMQELLLIADVLITDYSSSIWDFAITGKKSFLFVPDLDEYENNERGFLTPFDKWPGIKVTSNIDFVEKILNFSDKELEIKANLFMVDCVSYEKGNACKIIKDAIRNSKRFL